MNPTLLNLRPPLPERKLKRAADAIRKKLGLTIPEDYMCFLRRTNGLQTQSGYLSGLGDVGDMNAIRWFMEPQKRAAGESFYWNDYKPLENPPVPTYILLGYENSHAELVYDIAARDYLRRSLHYKDQPPFNSERSLVGMLRNLIYDE